MTKPAMTHNNNLTGQKKSALRTEGMFTAVKRHSTTDDDQQDDQYKDDEKDNSNWKLALVFFKK